MQFSPQAPAQSQRCPLCRADVSAGVDFCEVCGSDLTGPTAQEMHHLNYLLSELSGWEEEGIVGHEQASRLREKYEQRREQLRLQLATSGKRARLSATSHDANVPVAQRQTQQPSPTANIPPHAQKPHAPRRAILETLSDPHTIRILLYTGAAMLVVGVVIWLRDILYLKLREPIVQATLLMIGTIIVTVCGWLTILRSRLRLTGRALTLMGSLLVPVNFWFLVRSGLIENNGRAWLVCAFCAALYALTAASLRERLYVYLASLAAISTLWAVIYRVEREAFGLYVLALMAAALVFLHLSRVFPKNMKDGRLTRDEGQTATDSRSSSLVNRPTSLMTQMGDGLWSLPLVHVALVGVAFALLLYMPLRTGSSSSFADGLFRLRASEYDPGIAMLLSAAVAYAAWFAGRYIFLERRALLYTASALALFWTEFLAADGLRLSGASQLLLLALTAQSAVLAARVLDSDAWALALHRASLTVIAALAILTYPVISISPTSSLKHSLILILLTMTYALSGSSRMSSKTASETPAHISIAFACAALTVLQAIIHLRLGDSELLVPSVVLGTTGLLLLFGASFRLSNRERVRCFRAGLFALITAFTLAALRAGFDPFGDVEAYTSPVALLLLFLAHLYARHNEDEYASDTKLLLWAGSLLLAAPLLLHALQYRLFLDLPSTWRDLAMLCAALALLIFGIVRRLRAPVLVGATALAIELSALALTSVGWLQIPLKVYLISTGALILLIWGALEFRREQILLMRKRINERREMAREQFGEWK